MVYGARNASFLSSFEPQEDAEDIEIDTRSLLGKFVLDDVFEGEESIFKTETFALEGLPEADEYAGGLSVFELDISSNYGNDRFTCIYQVKVHGKAAGSKFNGEIARESGGLFSLF